MFVYPERGRFPAHALPNDGVARLAEILPEHHVEICFYILVVTQSGYIHEQPAGANRASADSSSNGWRVPGA